MPSLKNFVPALKALDWQLILLKAALVIVILASAYGLGRFHEKQAQAERENKEMQAVVKKVEDFIPTLQTQATKAAEQNVRVERKQEKYNEAVNANPRPESCDLSNDELRSFQELAEG